MATASPTLTQKRTVRGSVPRIPFEDIKNAILGTSYELSVVVVGDALMRRLNKEHRNKDYPTNVLAFPLDAKEGEIFLNLRKIEREAPHFEHSTRKHFLYLFIHACLHLKGHTHGSSMEKLERTYLTRFGA